jgi:hypothetical protein
MRNDALATKNTINTNALLACFMPQIYVFGDRISKLWIKTEPTFLPRHIEYRCWLLQ